MEVSERFNHITLVSSDCKEVIIDHSLIEKISLLNNLVGDLNITENKSIDSQYSSKILYLIIKYLEDTKDEIFNPKLYEHDEDTILPSNVSDYEEKFMSVLDDDTLCELTKAANYYCIMPLYVCCCKTIANLIKGKKTEEIRKRFNIKDDLTDEDKEMLTSS